MQSCYPLPVMLQVKPPALVHLQGLVLLLSGQELQLSEHEQHQWHYQQQLHLARCLQG
jgi:hypothetical protein